MVGCGGSGGSTLQFVMDQLRADLARYDVDHLPKGWQFVHIDVPLEADGVRPGLPPTVPEQGGQYAPLAFQGATFPAVWNGLEQTLATTPRARNHLSPWAPDPGLVNVPVAMGAGQYRAVGRVLTLPKVNQIGERLRAAWSALMPEPTLDELRAIAAKVSPATGGQVSAAPLVLVVSSMAGGAGASMVLDVCRVLSGVPGVDPNVIGLFLFTPQLFESLPDQARQGVDANAMAMMGELFAAQVNASAATDPALLRSLGLAHSGGASIPFKRVFPVGAKIGGDGTPFGDGSIDGIYRALGRGLAALMMSGTASQEFASFDLGNAVPIATDQESLGWAASADLLQWGSFGYASVGLGRERYAEYAAQRLARVAVDRLVEGHIQPGDTRNGTEQLASAADARWVWFGRDRLGLPAGFAPPDVWKGWFLPLFPDQLLRGQITDLFGAVLGRSWLDQGQANAAEWLGGWRAFAAGQRPELSRRLDDLAYAWAYEWYEQLTARVEQSIEEVISQSGLQVAQALITRLGRELPAWIAALRERAATGPADPSRSRPEAENALGALRGLVTGSHAALEGLRRGHLNVLRDSLYVRGALLAADILTSMRTDLLEPLSTAMVDEVRELAAARTEMVVDRGQARVETDEYTAWPSGVGAVGTRFSAAQNEVLLTGAADFERIFLSHIAAATGVSQQTDAIAAVVTQVLSGAWSADGGAVPGVPVRENKARWRPSVLPTDPGVTGLPKPMQRAAYTLLFGAADVLARARLWLRRPNEPFSRFVGQSLFEYLSEDGIPATDLAERAAALRERFGQALSSARPLVGVQPLMFAAVHRRPPLESYKFSEVPFQGLPLEDQIRSDLAQRTTLDPTTVAHFGSAVCLDNNSTRVDIFGSYAPCSPLVFSSLLDPIAERWSRAVVDGATKTFWQWRRTRRLPAAIPATDAARRAMIGGFFVGRLTGQIRIPGEGYTTTVDVWDPAKRAWQPFPERLLTDPEGQRDPRDLLPALLESLVIAMAACHSRPDLGPLLPYRRMRELFDDTPNAPFGGDPSRISAARHLGHWIATGTSPSGTLPSAANAGAATGSAETRQAAVLGYLTKFRGFIETEYLARGELGAAGGGTYSSLDHVRLSDVPLFHEIAPDAYEVLDTLRKLVEDFAVPPPNGGPGL